MRFSDLPLEVLEREIGVLGEPRDLQSAFMWLVLNRALISKTGWRRDERNRGLPVARCNLLAIADILKGEGYNHLAREIADYGRFSTHEDGLTPISTGAIHAWLGKVPFVGMELGIDPETLLAQRKPERPAREDVDSVRANGTSVVQATATTQPVSKPQTAKVTGGGSGLAAVGVHEDETGGRPPGRRRRQ